ncbi:MAG: hypothetical protein IPM51_05585 [Sphingobacteriaceae bacterium]|nr:hypothetical protein [Sphingobacteriaceae bacterium]
MKFSLSGILLLLFISSCKKEYTCTCTSVVNGNTATSVTKATMRKKDSKTWCNSSTSFVSAGTSASCELS